MRELVLNEINIVAGGVFADDMVAAGKVLQDIGGGAMAVGAVTAYFGGSGLGIAGFGGMVYLSGALLEYSFS